MKSSTQKDVKSSHKTEVKSQSHHTRIMAKELRIEIPKDEDEYGQQIEGEGVDLEGEQIEGE